MRKFVSLVFAGALVLGGAVGAAQDAGRKKGKEQLEPEWKPATVPAPALAFGAALDEAALSEFKDWAWAHVKKVMRAQPVDPRGTIEVVDHHYAAASDLARDAGIYLVYYFAYKDDDENQRMLAFRVRDIDRETYEISRELQILWETLQNSLTRGALNAERRIRQDEQEQKLNAKLRDLGDERQMKATQIAASRKKVNIYLKLMAAAFEKMKGTDPAVIRALK